VIRCQNRPLVSQPGEAFLYSNLTYLVLGHLIQVINGRNFETFLKENIFDPLGMKDTGLHSPAVQLRRASTYTASRNRPDVSSSLVAATGRAGQNKTLVIGRRVAQAGIMSTRGRFLRPARGFKRAIPWGGSEIPSNPKFSSRKE
jgi:CubicO group peptidase (beta-lactamase class C family)